jgi:transposase
MLLVGYCCGIRSERRLCEGVHLDLVSCWFCHLGLTDPVPNHSTFSKNWHGRFRDNDLLRQLLRPPCGAAWPRASWVARASRWMPA